jgi:Family of unknown function (DUF6220)
MASSTDTRRPSPDVTGPRRAVLRAYRWLLLGFLLLGAVQIFLAGLGAFRIDSLNVSGETAFAPHRAVGFAMGGVALVIFILALIARAGTRAAVLAGVLFVLAFLAQSVLASLADHSVFVGGLHALDGLAILGIAAFLYASVRRRQS